MTIDHIGVFLIPGDTIFYIIFRSIGRIAFPLFAFLIAQGFIHTKSISKYLMRLIILAIIFELMLVVIYLVYGINMTHIPFLENNVNRFNIVWALILGLLGLILLKKNSDFSILLVLVLFAFSQFLSYSFYGFGLIIIFGIFKQYKDQMKYAIPLTIIYSILPIFSGDYIGLIQLFSLISLLIIYFYNQKRGLNHKYLFYIYYPLHVIILVLLSIYL